VDFTGRACNYSKHTEADREQMDTLIDLLNRLRPAPLKQDNVPGKTPAKTREESSRPGKTRD